MIYVTISLLFPYYLAPMKKWMLLCLPWIGLVHAQTMEEFSVSVEEVFIDNMPGLQSFAWAQHNGLWLLPGGRTDGLHEHMPPSAFPESGENNTIYVISPETNEVWTAETEGLSSTIREQLASTNMAYFQDGDTLLFAGGYGYYTDTADHATFPYLMVIDVPGLINAVMTGEDISPFIMQTAHSDMANTGGHMGKLNGRYFLAGGQRFDGRYNPHGGASFTQTYADRVLWFTTSVDDVLHVNIAEDWTDAGTFHRRDYNMLPQLSADGDLYYTMFSGVFRPDIDLPWLDGVHVFPDHYSTLPSMTQLLNQYHTASLPIYAEDPYAMHTLFFGGIGLYYYEGGNLYIDSLVPFTSNISRMTTTGGDFSEYLMEASMPGWLGASAEFIPLETEGWYADGILQLDQLPYENNHVGYIVGGIESEFRNIFMLTGTSWASTKVFRVMLNRTGTMVGTSETAQRDLKIYPNPAENFVVIEWAAQQEASYMLVNSNGDSLQTGQLQTGRNELPLNTVPAGMYWLRIQNDKGVVVHQLVKN